MIQTDIRDERAVNSKIKDRGSLWWEVASHSFFIGKGLACRLRGSEEELQLFN